jgi:hypothetical protein
MKKYIKPNIKVVVLNEALAATVTSDPVNPGGANAKDNTTEPTPATVSGTSNSKGFWED